jgi:hypothetical protein
MSDCVVVIRLEDGDDILAIMHSELDGVVRVEHPYYIKVDSSNVVMMPFCALTDEVFFEFKKEKIQFLVTANREITEKFLRMVDAMEYAATTKAIQEDSPYDELQSMLRNKSFIKGTDTKH